ncbi:MAG: toprim domain-containing protein, partial [Polaromonas sp.]
MSSHIADFHQAIEAAGLEAPGVIDDDGALHRFGKGKSAYYVLHGDGIPAGMFGDWRSGLQSTWCAKSSTSMTPAERDAHKQRIQAAQAQRDADEVQRHEATALEAGRLLEASQPCTDNGYLSAKGATAYGVRQDGQTLLIPMRDTSGKLWNIERVNPADFKDKRGLFGGKRKGCFHAIGKPKGKIIVCEGYATGASIHEATLEAVAVAFNAGNLMPVATALHTKYPQLQIILAADDDVHTDGNPGMTKATAAALAVGGAVAVPEFGADRPDGATDFNDLHQMAGLDAVKACFDGAAAVAIEASDMGDWPAPTPLPDALPPVMAFDAELMPLALRAWVMDVSHRMQCPPDFPAVAALVAISSLIGARAVVQPKARDDWQVVPNLWGM